MKTFFYLLFILMFIFSCKKEEIKVDCQCGNVTNISIVNPYYPCVEIKTACNENIIKDTIRPYNYSGLYDSLGLHIELNSNYCIPDYDMLEDSIIRNYLASNLIDFNKTDEGIYYSISDTISNNHPNINSIIKVKYTGYLINGEIFDKTENGSIASFYLPGVIKGLQIGIQRFSKGNTGKLIIPSKYAYGFKYYQKIPPFSILVFDITLVSFN